MSETPPELAYLYAILEMAVEQGASDILFRPNDKVYIRKKTELPALTQEVIPAEKLKQILFRSMPDKVRAHFEEHAEADYSIYPWGPENQRFRVNIYTAQGQVGAVMRVVTHLVKSIDDLGLPNILKDIVSSHNGLVLIAGATGSGKSTTLAAMLDHVNQNQVKNIFTIEDPVEIMHKSRKSRITHREVGEDTRSFAAALRSAMRQNPDIILVGEIRDRETAEAALTAAQTGHLVLSTIHAGTAEEAVQRFANIFPPEDRENIKKTLGITTRAILAQRLIMDVNNQRTPLLEIMTVSHRIEQAIFDSAEGTENAESLTQVIEESQVEGMRSIDQHLQELVMSGKIHPRTAVEQAVDRLKLIQKLKQQGVPTDLLM